MDKCVYIEIEECYEEESMLESVQSAIQHKGHCAIYDQQLIILLRRHEEHEDMQDEIMNLLEEANIEAYVSTVREINIESDI